MHSNLLEEYETKELFQMCKNGWEVFLEQNYLYRRYLVYKLERFWIKTYNNINNLIVDMEQIEESLAIKELEQKNMPSARPR